MQIVYNMIVVKPESGVEQWSEMTARRHRRQELLILVTELMFYQRKTAIIRELEQLSSEL